MDKLQFAKAHVAGIFLTLLGRDHLDADWTEPVDDNPHYVAAVTLPHGDKLIGRAFHNGYWQVEAKSEMTAGIVEGDRRPPFGCTIVLAYGWPPEPPVETESAFIGWPKGLTLKGDAVDEQKVTSCG